MIRTAVAYTLAATVLICPYMCLGQMAGRKVAQFGVTACSCHGELCPPNDGGPPDDNAPEDRDNKQPDCLCHGAIVDGAKVEGQAAFADFSLVRTMDILPEIDAAVSSVKRSIDRTAPCHFPHLSSAREICALCGSLLL